MPKRHSFSPFICSLLRLRLRPKNRREMVLQSSEKQEIEEKRTKQTNRMLICMVILFGSAWLPLNIINLLTDLNFWPMSCWEYYHSVFIMCHATAMISACCNPFIYGRFNDSFRKEFLELFPKLKFFCGNFDNSVEMRNANELQILQNAVAENLPK